MISSIFFCALTFFIEAHALIYIYIYFEGKTSTPPNLHLPPTKYRKKHNVSTTTTIYGSYRKASVSHAQKMGQFAKATANFIAAYASLTQSMEDEKKRKLESQVGATLKRLRFSKIKWFCSCIPQLEIVSQFPARVVWEILFSGFNVRTHSNSMP